MAKLDAAVWERIGWVLQHPDVIAAEVERRRHKDRTPADIATIDRAIADVER